jgi:hypothetical protein|nr:MAG TPA: hypothetical protein [Caudoviricetes sp.]
MSGSKEIKIYSEAYEYENIVIITIDGENRVMRKSDGAILGPAPELLKSSRVQLPELPEVEKSRTAHRFQDTSLRIELAECLKTNELALSDFVKQSNILNYHQTYNFLKKGTRMTLQDLNEIKRIVNQYVCNSK